VQVDATDQQGLPSARSNSSVSPFDSEDNPEGRIRVGSAQTMTSRNSQEDHGSIDLQVEQRTVKSLVADRTLVRDLLTGSSAEDSDLCIQLLVDESTEQGAGRGTVSVANKGNVSMIVKSVNVGLSQPGISLWLENRCGATSTLNELSQVSWKRWVSGDVPPLL